MKYLLGRLSVIGLRPILLYFLLQVNVEQSNLLALCFIVLTVGMFGSAFDSGRFFYTSSTSLNGVSLIAKEEYFFRLVIAGIVLGVPLIFLTGLFYSLELTTLLLITLYFLSERAADEYLRLMLFKNNIDNWGAFNILRLLIAVPLTFIACAVPKYSATSDIILIVLAVANIIALYYMARSSIKTILKSMLISTNFFERVYIQLVFMVSKYKLYVAVVLTGLLTYLDRYIFSVFDRESIASFLLCASCAQVLSSYYDYFYFSKNRSTFMCVSGNVLRLIFNFRSVIAIISGAAIAISSLCLLFILNENLSLNIVLIALLLVLQIIYSFTVVIREVLHYRNIDLKVPSVEFATLLILLVISKISISYTLSVDFVFILMLLVYSIRLYTLVVIAS